MIQKIKNTYCDKRMLFIFLNGIASGFPWVIIGSMMTLWLKDAGFSRTAIGFFGSIFFVYSINWLWSPLLDKIKIPILTAKIGYRRAWLLVLQALLFIFIVILSLILPNANNLIFLSFISLLIAIMSATQDIVIDAYRIEIINDNEEEKIAAGSSVTTAGWWFGFGFLGAFALYIVDLFTWNMAYFTLSFIMLFFMLVTIFMLPTEYNPKRKNIAAFDMKLLTKLFINPLKDFFITYKSVALLLLLFIVFFKIGEAFLGKMSLVFYDEIGFTKSDIATYSKLLGATITIIFSIVASFITIHFGIIRGLIIGGIAMASTNLMYSYLAIIGPDTNFLAITIFLDNFTSAFSTVAFVAFISFLVNKAYTATQYALLASIGNLGKTLLAGLSGLLIDGLDGNWFIFFILTAIMVIPSLIILLAIMHKLKQIINVR